MSQADIRQYQVEARSTDVFGRVLCRSRQHHFVADGPVQNGCPGEALTPAELFLSGIAGCGVELIQVLAREQNLPLEAVDVAISGVLDRSNPVHPDFALFNAVRLRFFLRGVSDEDGAQLIESFKRR